jgi:ATP-binding cassette subfamily B protein
VKKANKLLDFSVLSRLLRFLSPYKLRVGLALAALGVATASELAVPVLLQNGIDKGVLKGDVVHLALVSFVILGLILLDLGVSFFQVYGLAKVSQDVMRDMRTALFARLQRRSSAWLHATPTGRLVSGVTSDVATLSDFFNTLLSSMLKDFVTMAGVVVTLFILNSSLAWFTVLSLPPVLILAFLFRRWSRGANRKVREGVSRVTTFLSEYLAGMSLVQLFARERTTRQRFEGENVALLKANLTEMMVNAVFRPLIDVLNSITLGVLIWFGTGLHDQGLVTLGALVAFINLVGRFYQPVGDIAENFTLLQSAMAGAERVQALWDDENILPDSGNLDWEEVPEGPIQFHDVYFRYQPDEPVLDGLNLTLETGKTLAVVGYTGAGKTTLTHLMTRLWDVSSGSITYSGHDLREFHLDSLRCNVQSVLQDVLLFSGTIAENIDLGRGLERPMMEEICRRVHAHDFITALPLGYETPLSEGATNLSAGQRQLLSFARTLAQDPKVLILDEATANIDTSTESLIQEALRELLKGRTSLVIAHRLSTIRAADKILVLDRGKIAESGTHEELLVQKGFYYDLYRLQYASSSLAKVDN